MKVKKLVKYLDTFSNIEIYNENDELLWAGDTLLIAAAAAADTNYDKKQFIKKCRADGDFETIAKIKSAEKFLDRKLFMDNEIMDGNISAKCRKNAHGVDIITFMIYVE